MPKKFPRTGGPVLPTTRCHGLERLPGVDPPAYAWWLRPPTRKHYGRSHGAQELRELCEIGKDGVNLLGISESAERIGFRATGVKTSKLIKNVPHKPRSRSTSASRFTIWAFCAVMVSPWAMMVCSWAATVFCREAIFSLNKPRSSSVMFSP